MFLYGRYAASMDVDTHYLWRFTTDVTFGGITPMVNSVATIGRFLFKYRYGKGA